MHSIIKAIKNVDIPQVKKLIVENPSTIDETDDVGIPAPFLAAETGSLPLVQYIVEYSRASMNLRDDNERSILHYAARSGNKELVEYLVERVGMDPLEGDKDLKTPFEIAYNLGNKEVETYFEKRVGASYDQMYQNPIRRGTFPDPSIVRVGENYYMVNSSFTYFPCIPISHSKDLIHWRIIGHAITESQYANLEELESGRGYWAPDISYYEGKFYITATYRLNDNGKVYRRQIVVSSDKPEGPYTKPAYIEEDGIDPSIFNDEDGRRYMLLNRGARILELNKSATEQISEAKILWYGSQKRAPEGPHLLKKGGYYYLFLAEGGTGMGHQISVARSKTLMGPYENCPYNPIMIQRNPKATIQRAGHGKPVQTQNGEWFMVYLCGRRHKDKYSILGRETALDPITWTEDGWPIVNGLKGPSALQKKPILQENIVSKSQQDIFHKDKLDLNWMWVKIPSEHAYEKVDEGIRLYGSQYPLYHTKARNILVQRQTKFDFQIETHMEYHCPKEGQETGITCYYDENTYLTFGIHNREGDFSLSVTERIGETLKTPFLLPVPQGYKNKGIVLRIETEGLRRSFWYGFEEKADKLLGVLDHVYYLCDEGYDKGKRFTGAMVGLYAVSQAYEEGAWGNFSYFKIL